MEYYEASKATGKRHNATTLYYAKKKAMKTDFWKRHNEYHWYTDINGKRLDYWPSRNKFRYAGGKTMAGNVTQFIYDILNGVVT